MARKDTLNALVSRGINEQTAELLLTKFSTLKAINDAGVSGIIELGIEEPEANDVIAKISKRVTKKSKEAEEEVFVQFEAVTKAHEYTKTETELKKICDKKGYELPLKIIVDIAGRIERKKVTDEEKDKILCTAFDTYKKRIMDANESVGIMAAQSIGEPGTQMNMRTFHYAGVANVNVTSGLPRLIEIVDARRVPSTPSMTVPLTGLAAEDDGIAKKVAYSIEMTKLLDVADIETDIINMKLKISPDPRKMDIRGVNIDEIIEKLNKIKALRGLVEKDGYSIIVTCDKPSNKELQKIHEAAKNAKIKGIDNVYRALLSKGNDGKWEIVTEGSNLKEVMKIPGVDGKNVKTNSILEVADVLGIEAARNALIEEARNTLSAAGTVDIRHIMLVADLMTNDGYVKAIGRHGISGRKSSVLARAAFEITAPHLLHAAMNGEEDRLEGVAENIIVGQPVTLGTGAVNLIYTPKKGDKE